MNINISALTTEPSLLIVAGMSPQSVEEAGGLGVSGDLAVCPAQVGYDGAHADAGGPAQVPAALRVEAGGSSQIFSVKGELLLGVSAEGEPSLLQACLLLWLDQPPVDRVDGLLLSVLLILP